MTMANLSDIDRQLNALGGARPDLEDLVARYGEGDRSLVHVDDALRSLGAGVTLTGFAAPSPRGQDVRSSETSRSEPPAKVRMRDLLDQELDPKEFPQTVPPPPPDVGAEARPPDDEGFELLVGDDDILEVEDDDTQVTYEPES